MIQMSVHNRDRMMSCFSEGKKNKWVSFLEECVPSVFMWRHVEVLQQDEDGRTASLPRAPPVSPGSVSADAAFWG